MKNTIHTKRVTSVIFHVLIFAKIHEMKYAGFMIYTDIALRR